MTYIIFVAIYLTLYTVGWSISITTMRKVWKKFPHRKPSWWKILTPLRVATSLLAMPFNGAWFTVSALTGESDVYLRVVYATMCAHVERTEER